MRIEELTIEVRDRDLNRIGQVTGPFVKFRGLSRWCSVGEWELSLPSDHPMVGTLSQAGSGIVVTGPVGQGPGGETLYGPILSGPTTTPERTRNREQPDGTYRFVGVTDEVHLLDALAYPSPSIADPAAQTAANDTRTGTTEDLMRQYVAYNIAHTNAPPARVRGIREHIQLRGSSGGRGITARKSPRFQNLLELLQEIVLLDSTLGFRMLQYDDKIEFEVVQIADRRDSVRFDIDNGTVLSEVIHESGPTATYAIVAGQGEGTDRQMVVRTNPDAVAGETTWGRVIEQFIDRRDTEDLTELDQAGDERLAEGRAQRAVKLVPADNTTMRAGIDWNPGDWVTTVADDVETWSAITERVIIANETGVYVGAAIGDVTSFTPEGQMGVLVGALDSRVANLERSLIDATTSIAWGDVTGKPSVYPTNWSNVASKPSTFPPSAHTHPWGDVTGKPATFAPSAHKHNASDIDSGTLAAARLPAATESAIGAVERATAAEANAGTDNTRYVTPLRLKGVVDNFRTAERALPTPFRSTSAHFGTVYPIGTPASVWGSVIATVESPLLSLPAPAWVKVEYGAILSASTGYARVGLVISGPGVYMEPGEDGQGDQGSTGGLTPFHMSAQQSWVQGQKTVLLPAGDFRLVLQSMRSNSSATCTFNYPMIQVTPLRWA